jgi:hypothetical protein
MSRQYRPNSSSGDRINLVEAARDQQENKQSLEWLASTWYRGSANA